MIRLVLHLVCTALLGLSVLGHAQLVSGSPATAPAGVGQGAAVVQPVVNPVAAAPSPAPKNQVYQQRLPDGRVVFTDRPLPQAVTEREWSIPKEEPMPAEKRRDQSRQQAADVTERIQRQIERERDRETALAVERMRLNEASAQREAELARADRQRALEYERIQPPVIVVSPPPPHRRPGAPAVSPPLARPPPPPSSPPSMLCGQRNPADCNPGPPGRAGFGGR